jgi:2-hydroxy-6-oxonona-2,4-dienedioate hydrolase
MATTAVSEHPLTEENIVSVPGLLSRWVRLGDGSMAHYMTSGESGPAVILLHGGIEGSSGTAGWRFMAPFLGANGFRVFCPDMPGFGLSDVSKPEYLKRDRKAHVDFIRLFADAICVDKFHISGNSMGCINACNFLVSHPERILSVAFIAGFLGDITDPANRVAPKDGKFTPNPGYVSPGFDGTNDSMRILMEGIIYAQSAIWPELIEMRVSAAQRHRKAREAAGLKPYDFSAASDPNDEQVFTTKDRLPKITIPMIYMYGKADVLIPVENGFQQEDALDNIQFFYTEECGHQGQTDQPEVFNQTFLEFFRDGKVGKATAKRAGVSDRRAVNPRYVEA